MTGCVYIISWDSPGRIKIGMSKEPIARMKNVAASLGIRDYQTYVSQPHKNPRLTEKICHGFLLNLLARDIGKKYQNETFICSSRKAIDTLEYVLGSIIKPENIGEKQQQKNLEFPPGQLSHGQAGPGLFRKL